MDRHRPRGTTTTVTGICIAIAVGAVCCVRLAAATTAFPSLEEISQPLNISLPAPAHATFNTVDPTDPGDRELASEIVARWPELRFSSQLARVAEAYAAGSVASAEPDLPQRFVHSLLSWAGAVENDAVVITVSTSEDSTIDVMNQLARAIDAHRGEPFSHVGLGRARLREEPFRWRWVAVLSRRLLELEGALPRSHSPQTTIILRFRVFEPLADPAITIVRSGGDTETVPLDTQEDGWFEAEIATGTLPGTMWLEVVAISTVGPVLAAQLPLYVGSRDDVDSAAAWHGRTTPDESFISSTQDAERLMVELVNADRARYGLRALHHDSVLTAVARGHSSDMRNHAFFSHISPTRGDLQQRLDAAGYRAATARENICKAATVYGAQESLLRSPSHRANIFAGDIDSVGIGIAIELETGGSPSYVVTQVFATSLSRPSVEQVRDAVAELVDRQRDAVAAPALKSLPKIDRVALDLAAGAAANGRLESSGFRQAYSDLDAAGLTIRELQAELLTTNSVGAIRLSDTVFEKKFNAVGIGVTAHDDEEGMPLYTVVILLVDAKEGR